MSNEPVSSMQSRCGACVCVRPPQRVRIARFVACVLAAIAATTLCTAKSSGASITWSATAGTTAWSTGANWVGSVAPANDLTTDVAVFNQTTYQNVPNVISRSVGGIVVGDGTTATAAMPLGTGVSANRLVIGGSGITMNANAGSFTTGTTGAQGVLLGANQTWTNNSSNALTVRWLGNVNGTDASTPYVVTVAGNGTGGVAISTGVVSGTSTIASAGSAVGFIVDGGRLTLSGANTIDGGVNLKSGSLLLASNNALGSGSLMINGGRLAVTTLSGTGTLIRTTAASVVFNADFTAGEVRGTALVGLQLSLDGAMTLTGNRTITVDSGAGFNLYGGVSDGGSGYGITKNGSSLMRLAGTNTYTGDTRVDGGELTIFSNLAAQVSALDTSGGGAFVIAAASPTIGGLKGSKNMTINAAVGTISINPAPGVTHAYSGVIGGSTSIIKINSGTQVFFGANTYTGATDIRAGTLQIGNAGTTGALSLSSAITGSAGGTLAFNRTNSVTQGTEFNSVIGGGINVAQLGSGTLVLNGANTYTGTTAITAGVLALNHADALGGGGSVRFGGGTLRYSGSNTVDYAARIRNSTAAVSIDTAGQNVLFAGGIDATNVGGLTKLGAGRLTLAGSNAYTGGTLVDAGSLIVNGSLVGDVVVGANSLLGGAGVLGNTLSGAGTIGVGNSPGIGTAAAVNPAAGTDWIFEVTGTAPAWNAGGGASVNDVLRLTDSTPFLASLTSGNTVNVLFGLGATPVVQGSYLGGFFVDNAAFDLAAALAGGQFQYWVEGEYGTSGQRQQFPVGPDGASVTYSLLSAYDSSLTASYTIAQQTVDFGSGSVTGAVTQFIVVPEPHAAIGAGVGIALACGVLRNRRRTP